MKRISKKHITLVMTFLLVCFLIPSVSGEHSTWDCPECGRTGNSGNYCGTCAHHAPWIANSQTQIESSNPIAVGDIVYLGRYEQDNDFSNGSEAIEWIVLTEYNEKILLLSKYALDIREYEHTNTDITWDYSDIREWLNSVFYNTAFTSAEKERIVLSEVNNSMEQGNPDYNRSAGTNTQDHVFLLSFRESERYLDKADARYCEVTPYVINSDSWNSSWFSESLYRWWLRSPGHETYPFVMDIEICDNGCAGYFAQGCGGMSCIRPAILIKKSIM